MANKTNTKGIQFEDALDRLESIINKLQDGHLTLDESLKNFQEGIELIKMCQEKLDYAETKVALLIKNSDGTTNEIPFDLESER